jgi:hypothetical protein
MSKHDMVEIMSVELDKGTKTVEYFKQFTPTVYCDREQGYCRIIGPKFLLNESQEDYNKWMDKNEI